jgi:hypothetical protein
MKALRFGAILATLATALLACLWVLDLVSGEQAVEALKRVLAVLGIVTLALWVVLAVSGRGRSAS